MSYIFTNTEKTKEKASDYETFSSLYMIGIYRSRNNIDFILADCFNDVSCINSSATKIYDVQSKGYKENTAKQIGFFLYTLFKNHQSNFPFDDFILFLETIGNLHVSRKISQSSFYKITDFSDTDRELIRNGLIKETQNREKRELINSELSDIEKFLSNVKFVVCNYSKEDIVKRLIPLKNTNFKSTEFYTKIFDEIRDRQSSLKNINIENKSIENPIDVLGFKKFIKKNDIFTLLINRVVGAELFTNKNVPLSFINKIKNLDEEEQKDILQNCNTDLARLFFDKNNKTSIWKLLASIVYFVQIMPELDIDGIYSCLDKGLLNGIPSLSELTIKYFIARVKEGMND